MSSSEEPSPATLEPPTPLIAEEEEEDAATAAATATATAATAAETAATDASSPTKPRGAPQIRPKGVHTKHLTELERFRVRTLYYDACMTKRRIHEVTGYSESQIRTAVRAKSFEIGKRTGRPRKGYKIHGPSVGEAQDESPDSFQEDSTMSIDEAVQGQLLANALQSPGPTTPPSGPRGFNDLPDELRTQIWKLVLSAAGAAPLRRSWSFITQPSSPWLYLDTSYAAETLRNPPWSQYIQQRHGSAMALCGVNREARRAVLDAFTPVVTAAAPVAPPGIRFRPMPSFVWVDLKHDSIGFFGATQYTPDMFDKARRAALPAVRWRS